METIDEQIEAAKKRVYVNISFSATVAKASINMRHFARTLKRIKF